MQKILYILSVLILLSCNNVPQCDDPYLEFTLRDMLEDELNYKKDSFEGEVLYALNNPNINIEDYIKKYVNLIELKNIRKTNINNEIEKCDCRTEIDFSINVEDFPKEIQKDMKNTLSSFLLDIEKEKRKVTLDYSVQNTSNQAYIEFILPDDMLHQFVQYLTLQYMIDTARIETEKSLSEGDVDKATNDALNLFYQAELEVWDYCYSTRNNLDFEGNYTYNLSFNETSSKNISGIYGYYGDEVWGFEFSGFYDEKTELYVCKGLYKDEAVNFSFYKTTNFIRLENPFSKNSRIEKLAIGICDEVTTM